MIVKKFKFFGGAEFIENFEFKLTDAFSCQTVAFAQFGKRSGFVAEKTESQSYYFLFTGRKSFQEFIKHTVSYIFVKIGKVFAFGIIFKCIFEREIFILISDGSLQ